MAKIIGNTTATPNPRPDWNQTDATKADFIKNKPDIEEIVDQKVAEIVDAAPEALDTLNELAAALGDDPNFATTILTEIGNKPGVKTPEGGEIFNDYENNQAIGADSFASGVNTQAGGKGFGIQHIAVSALDGALDLVVDNAIATVELDAMLAYAEANQIDITTLDVTIIAQQPSGENASRSWGNLDYCGKLIGVNGYKIQITNTFAANKEPWASEEQPAQLIIPALSQFGDIVTGVGANASGYDTKAIGAVANAEGYNNMAVGKYSHVDGRDNVAGGYASHVNGWGNQALTKAAFASGKNNKVYRYADYSSVFGEGNQVQWPYNFVTGRFADCTHDNSFVIGNGTDANNRSNAFEIRRSTGKATFKAVPQVNENGTIKTLATENMVNDAISKSASDVAATVDTKINENIDAKINENLDVKINENVDTKLTDYIKRNPGLTLNTGEYKQYFGVLLKNTNGEKEGYGPTGSNSVVNGDHCNANGKNAASFGYWGSANFDNSFSFGKRTVARNANQTVVGMDNAVEDDTANPSLFVVGNGTSNQAKSDAFKVRTDGSAELMKVGAKDNSVVTKKYVDDATVEIIEWPQVGIDKSMCHFETGKEYTIKEFETGTGGGAPYIGISLDAGSLFIWGSQKEKLPIGSKCVVTDNQDGSHKITCYIGMAQKASIEYVDTILDTKANIEVITPKYLPYDIASTRAEVQGIFTVLDIAYNYSGVGDRVILGPNWNDAIYVLFNFDQLPEELAIGNKVEIEKGVEDGYTKFNIIKDLKDKVDQAALTAATKDMSSIAILDIGSTMIVSSHMGDLIIGKRYYVDNVETRDNGLTYVNFADNQGTVIYRDFSTFIPAGTIMICTNNNDQIPVLEYYVDTAQNLAYIQSLEARIAALEAQLNA